MMSSVDSARLDQERELERERILDALQTPADRVRAVLDVPLNLLAGICLVFMVTFLNLINLQVDKDVVALDPQVLVKLMVIAGAGLYGIIGAMEDLRIRRILFSFPVFLVVILAGFYFLSSFTSIKKEHSLVSTIALLSVLLMTVTAMMQLGLVRFVTTVFHAMSLFVVLSWVVYFVWPEVGVFMEPITDGEFTQRMSGLAHSNTLGQYAGLTVIVGVALYHFYGQRSTWRLIVIGLAVGALLASLSRTSAAATVAGLMVMYHRSLFTVGNRKWFVIGAMLLLPVLLLVATQMDVGELIAEKMTIVSKSGDADELTSATGRAEIWQYSMLLISKQPLTGYGAATSKYFLEDYSMYTHNLLLNIAFSTGVFGGLVGLVMILHQAAWAVRRPHVVTSAVIVFILINGLFENVMFSIITGMPTLLWIMSMAWFQVREFNGGEESVKPLSLGDCLV